MIESSWRHASQPDWPRPEEALGLLRDHIAVDFDLVAVDAFRTLLDRAGRQAPEDDRVWLAWANLAIRTGRFADARRRLDACLGRRPEDPAVWQAVLDWGLATERVDEVRRALAHLPAERFSREPGRGPPPPGWRRGGATPRPSSGRSSALVQDEPGNCAAWERLAVLAAQAGRVEHAGELRRRKADMDRAKHRYSDLYNQNRFADDAPELARLAETLGRRFEAIGFLTWLARRQPGDPAVRAALARLQGAEARRGPPGRTLAQVLAADARPEAEPTSGRTPSAAIPPRPSSATTPWPPASRSSTRTGSRVSTSSPSSPAAASACIDYDGDGWLDVYLVQGGRFPPDPAQPPRGDRLFRNRRDGTFEDVTDASGIGGMAQGYGHGVAVGDYDNDGHRRPLRDPVAVLCLVSQPRGRPFEDVTQRAGLSRRPRLADLGRLRRPGQRRRPRPVRLPLPGLGRREPAICYDLPPEQVIIYCNPREFEPLPDHVFRNDGGRFIDVTARRGSSTTEGRGLGVVAADLDDDRRIDLFVANDLSANYLFRNLGGFRFEEIGQVAGVAANAEGGYQAGMGVACGDLDGDGRPDLAVTNFYGESTTFFRNLGRGPSPTGPSAVGLAAPSRYLLGFGIAFLDVDNDGRLDLLTANGHVNDYRPSVPYAMPIQLLRGGPDGRLRDVSAQAGPPFRAPPPGPRAGGRRPRQRRPRRRAGRRPE